MLDFKRNKQNETNIQCFLMCLFLFIIWTGLGYWAWQIFNR